MIKMILIFLLIPFFLSAECFDVTSGNRMAQEWKDFVGTSTTEIKDHWFYNNDGTINPDFAFASDDNFFEIKLLKNRILKDFYIIRDEKKLIYGENFGGLETRMIKVICPGAASSAAIVDPWEGLTRCNEAHYFYQVQGSSTFLTLKNGVAPIKEIK